MKRIIVICITAMLICRLLPVSVQPRAAEKDYSFRLTEEEQSELEWMKRKPLQIGVSERSVYHEAEVAWGMLVPIRDFFEYELGLETEIVYGTWDGNRDALGYGGIDLLFGIPVKAGAAEEQESVLCFSTPLYTSELYLVMPKGQTAEYLYTEGATVGMVEASYWREFVPEWLVHACGQKEYRNTQQLIQALAAGEVSAAVLPQSELPELYGYEELGVAEQLLAQEASVVLGASKQSEWQLLIEILDRYLLQTEEGEVTLALIEAESMYNSIRTFTEQEAGLLHDVESRYETFTYALLSDGCFPLYWENAGEAYGILPELFELWEMLTGISAERVTVMNDAEAVSRMEEGELVLLAGMAENGEGDEELVFAEPFGMTELVAVRSDAELERLEKEGLLQPYMDEREQIAYSYWGTVSPLLPLIAGTEFDGHTVAFESEAELLKALKEGIIGGALVERGVYEAQPVDAAIRKMPGFALAIPSSLAFYYENDTMNELMEKLLHVYELLYPDAWERWSEAGAEYMAAAAEDAIKHQKGMHYAEIAVLAVAAFVLLVVAWDMKARKRS